MIIKRTAGAAALAVSLAACSGGGSGPASPGSGSSGGTAPQSNFVTPKFTFRFPSPAGSSAAARSPKYVSPNSLGVTITLVSSSDPGIAPVSVASALTTGPNGTCSGTPETCTVNGPPVPPGTDVFSVDVYDAAPTGSPLTKPAGANTLSQTGSTATPNQGNPSFTVAAGSNATLTITLYGVPGTLTIGAGSAFTADAKSTKPLSVTVADHSGSPITGEFSAPVTVTDSDTGTQGTTLTTTGANPGTATATLNSSTDAVTTDYGGIAEVAPTITATAGTATSGAQKPYTITLNPIGDAAATGPSTQTADEIDLFALTGTGSTAQYTLSEAGWTDAPYSKSFTAGTPACSAGTPGTVFSLSNVGNVYTDTSPGAPASGICTINYTDFAGGQSVTETLTYTTGSITVNGKHRSR